MGNSVFNKVTADLQAEAKAISTAEANKANGQPVLTPSVAKTEDKVTYTRESIDKKFPLLGKAVKQLELAFRSPSQFWADGGIANINKLNDYVREAVASTKYIDNKDVQALQHTLSLIDEKSPTYAVVKALLEAKMK
jgi:hypothetical protein